MMLLLAKLTNKPDVVLHTLLDKEELDNDRRHQDQAIVILAYCIFKGFVE
jgi:hypothetical protein